LLPPIFVPRKRKAQPALQTKVFPVSARSPFCPFFFFSAPRQLEHPPPPRDPGPPMAPFLLPSPASAVASFPFNLSVHLFFGFPSGILRPLRTPFMGILRSGPFFPPPPSPHHPNALMRKKKGLSLFASSPRDEVILFLLASEGPRFLFPTYFFFRL